MRDQYYVTYPIGAYLTTHFMNGLKEKWTRIRPDIYRKIKVWFTRAKGGSFIKLSEKLDRISSSSVTFADVIGHEYEKSLIYPFIKYIKDPERWDARELTPPTGILLTGPTRSGKTFFAKAICGELSKQMASDSIRFISIDAHDIKANGIQTWMALAKAVAPCVIFIDEIDLLGLQRNQDKTMLSDFLQALSGIADNDPKKKVIVIGTTNKPENIDHALIQSGRLALEIRFKYPNLKERIEYIRKQLDKFAINPEAFDIDVNKLAHELEGRSFEDIKLVIDSAFIHVGIKGNIISQEILEWSLDTQLRKIIDIDTKEISDAEKRTLAAHFAGQVLTQILLNMEEQIAKVTIHQVVVKVKEESVYDQYYQQTKQTGLEQGALFTYLPNDTLDIKNQDEMLKKAKTLLGARVAERIVTNSCSTAYGWKKNSAFNMIKTIVADGIDLKSLSKNGQNAISDEALAKLKQCESEVEQLLIAHKPALIALTDALQNKQILTINQITKIIEQIEGKGLKQMQSILDPHTAPEKSAMSPNLNEDIVSNTDDADQEDDEEAEPAVI
jgi:cell division protease FtsH